MDQAIYTLDKEGCLDSSKAKDLSETDKEIIDAIRNQVELMNINNITRTEAYRQIYFQHPFFKKEVFQTPEFRKQNRFGLAQVLFPYVSKKGGETSKIRLAGLDVQHFTNVRERIKIGKRLYALLFGVKPIYEGAPNSPESIYTWIKS